MQVFEDAMKMEFGKAGHRCDFFQSQIFFQMTPDMRLNPFQT
jgi:hypothetical protein